MANIEEEFNRIMGGQGTPVPRQDGQDAQSQSVSQSPNPDNQSVPGVEGSMNGSSDIESAFNQILSGQEVFKRKTRTTDQLIGDVIPEEEAPVDLGTTLTASLISDPGERAAFLSQTMPNANIEIGKDGRIIIDGQHFNPKGFQLRDIQLASGEVAPFMGQVAGSLLGAAAGSSAGPVGTFGGAFAGGTAGGVMGRGLNEFILNQLDVDRDARDVAEALMDEAIVSASGEALGLGLVGVGSAFRRLGPRKYARGMSRLINRTFNKGLKEKGEDITTTIAQIATGTDKSVFEAYLRSNLSDNPALLENFMLPDKRLEIAARTIFRKPLSDITTKQQNFLKIGNVKALTKDLVESIKKNNSQEFNRLMASLDPKIDPDTVALMNKYSMKDIFSPDNFRDDASFNLADDFLRAAGKRKEELGSTLGAAELKAISGKKSPINIQIKEPLNRIVQQIDIIKKDIKTPQGVLRGVKSKDVEKLQEIVNLFKPKIGKKQAPNIGIDVRGNPVSSIAEVENLPIFDKLNPRQLFALKKRFDNLADNFFSSDASPVLRRELQQFAETFRGQYYNKLGLEEQAAPFRLLQSTLDEAKINPRATTAQQIEGIVERFGRQAVGRQNRIAQSLQLLPDGKGFNKRLELRQLGKTLERIDGDKVYTKFERLLNNKNILDIRTEDSTEALLRNISRDLFRNPRTKDLAFFDDAQKALIGNEFNSINTNMLRFQSIMGLTGVSAVASGMGGGAAGALAGGVGGFAGTALLTSPRNVARALSLMKKKGLITPVSGKTQAQALKITDKAKKAARKRRNITPESKLKKQQSIINALISRAMENN